jgi:hypothetical protein
MCFFLKNIGAKTIDMLKISQLFFCFMIFKVTANKALGSSGDTNSNEKVFFTLAPWRKGKYLSGTEVV